jgi:hypothetical protein
MAAANFELVSLQAHFVYQQSKLRLAESVSNILQITTRQILIVNDNIDFPGFQSGRNERTLLS